MWQRVCIGYSYFLFIYYLLCHIYPGVPHQCAALFSLGLMHVSSEHESISKVGMFVFPTFLWRWVVGNFFWGKSSQNNPKLVLIFWSSITCVFCLYTRNITLLKVVGYHDLSVLSMSVMGFQKNV